ncbi:MAG: sulfite exporter TauE/SafE family protein [Candidatus Moranbacteria bacterium]|nr:sulfite exporter TauE/SafE family protein [Candidatus Moranbacteria bacterium]
MSKKKKQKEGAKKVTYYVNGMHCASCEVLIEKTVLEKDGVTFVDVSTASGKVTIFGTKSLPDEKELNKIFIKDGYTFFQDKQKDKTKKDWMGYVIALTTAVVVLVLFSKMGGETLARFSSIDATSSVAAFFLLGVVASVSSCAALIGGILLSLTKQWNELQKSDKADSTTAKHINFHVGRVSAFAIGGGMLGLIGNAVSLQNITVYAILIGIVSLIMLFTGLQMLDIPFLSHVRIAMPKWIVNSTQKINKNENAPALIGAGTFFLPCGFTLIAQGAALATGSVGSGMLVMVAFALGTLPVLGAISVGGVSVRRRPHMAARFQLIAGALVVMFALYNINGQLNVLGFPSMNDLKKNQSQTVVTQEIKQAKKENPKGNEKKEENQILGVTAQGFEYIPTTKTTLSAGVQTTLVVQNDGIVGCGAFMAARGLFDGWIELKPGENTKIFIPKKGTYKLTCTMGMVPPVIITVK